MPFIRKNLSPVGGQSRRGVVPQVFSYTSDDDLATIKAAGYFPIDNSLGIGNNMLNAFSTNDIIMATHDTGTSALTSIIFIDNDGSDANDITTRSDDINSA